MARTTVPSASRQPLAAPVGVRRPVLQRVVRRLGPAAAALLAAAIPTALAAHPHIFIDTGIEVIFDAQGRAEALRISWSYDDLFSLSMIGDMGLDPDWDGKLTPEETARLSGFDMNWDPGFAGDTYALLGAGAQGGALSLSGPADWTASYDGKVITSTHLRRIEPPVDLSSQPLVVQVYDPGYYTAYTIAFDPVLTGRDDCTATAYAPDLSEADKALQAALAEYGADVDLEMEFPAVGQAYAEEIRITCPAR